jgi:hypothetical protein
MEFAIKIFIAEGIKLPENFYCSIHMQALAIEVKHSMLLPIAIHKKMQ